MYPAGAEAAVATCTKGNIWMAYNEVLADKEVAAGRVLACQGYPVGGLRWYSEHTKKGI